MLQVSPSANAGMPNSLFGHTFGDGCDSSKGEGNGGWIEMPSEEPKITIGCTKNTEVIWAIKLQFSKLSYEELREVIVEEFGGDPTTEIKSERVDCDNGRGYWYTGKAYWESVRKISKSVSALEFELEDDRGIDCYQSNSKPSLGAKVAYFNWELAFKDDDITDQQENKKKQQLIEKLF